MTIDSQVVRRRISHILTKVEYLKQQAPVTRKKLSNPTLRQAVERCLQVIAQAIIDISSSILADLRAPIPKSYREAILALGAQGILDEHLAQRLANLVSMRNILVHAYLDIDVGIIEQSIPIVIEDAMKFVSAIKRVLKEH